MNGLFKNKYISDEVLGCILELKCKKASKDDKFYWLDEVRPGVRNVRS